MIFELPKNPDKKDCLAFTLQTNVKDDWGIGFHLTLLPLFLTIHFVIGYMSLWWKDMSHTEMMKVLKGEKNENSRSTNG